MSGTYSGINSYPGSITIPSDGDGPGIRAADVNIPLEALADRTTNTKARLDPLALANAVLVHWSRSTVADTGETEVSHGSNVTSNVWTPIGRVLLAPWTTVLGDVVETTMHGHVMLIDAGAGGSRGWLRLESAQNGALSTSEIAGAKFMFGQPVASAQVIVPFTFVALNTVTAAGSYDLYMGGRINVNLGATLEWVGAYSVSMKCWRPQ